MHGYKWPINCTRTRTVVENGVIRVVNVGATAAISQPRRQAPVTNTVAKRKPAASRKKKEAQQQQQRVGASKSEPQVLRRRPAEVVPPLRAGADKLDIESIFPEDKYGFLQQTQTAASTPVAAFSDDEREGAFSDGQRSYSDEDGNDSEQDDRSSYGSRDSYYSGEEEEERARSDSVRVRFQIIRNARI